MIELEEGHLQTNVTGTLTALMRSTMGLRANAPGASKCADCQFLSALRVELTDAVFSAAFGRCDTPEVGVHITQLLLRQRSESPSGVLADEHWSPRPNTSDQRER